MFGKKKSKEVAAPIPQGPSPEEVAAKEQRTREAAATAERAARAGGAQTTQVQGPTPEPTAAPMDERKKPRKPGR